LFIDYYTHYLLFFYWLLFIEFFLFLDVYVVVGDAELEEGPVDFVVGNGGKIIEIEFYWNLLEIDFCDKLS